MKIYVERETVEYLKKIVKDAEGDDLNKAEAIFGSCSERALDIPQQGSDITPRYILDTCREKHARWEKVNKLLLSLLKDVGLNS